MAGMVDARSSGRFSAEDLEGMEQTGLALTIRRVDKLIALSEEIGQVFDGLPTEYSLRVRLDGLNEAKFSPHCTEKLEKAVWDLNAAISGLLENAFTLNKLPMSRDKRWSELKESWGIK